MIRDVKIAEYAEYNSSLMLCVFRWRQRPKVSQTPIYEPLTLCEASRVAKTKVETVQICTFPILIFKFNNIYFFTCKIVWKIKRRFTYKFHCLIWKSPELFNRINCIIIKRTRMNGFFIQSNWIGANCGLSINTFPIIPAWKGSFAETRSVRRFYDRLYGSEGRKTSAILRKCLPRDFPTWLRWKQTISGKNRWSKWEGSGRGRRRLSRRHSAFGIGPYCMCVYF